MHSDLRGAVRVWQSAGSGLSCHPDDLRLRVAVHGARRIRFGNLVQLVGVVRHITEEPEQVRGDGREVGGGYSEIFHGRATGQIVRDEFLPTCTLPEDVRQA